MSVHIEKSISVLDIRNQKGKEPVVCLTAYTTPMAKLLDQHCDLLLVGDSLGMVMYGFETTVPVTLDMMINHGAAVMRGAKKSCVIIDMPFGSYQESPAQAFRNATRIMQQTGAAGVKLEGGVEMAETIEFLVKRGIPVMAHIGLQPQSVNALGGFRARGRNDEQYQQILADADAVTKAGAFCVVVEGVMEPLAIEITERISIPTIGIGASSVCDGQILVSEDAFGLFSDFTPKFVRRFAKIGEQIDHAAAEYAEAVRDRSFPGTEHVFNKPKSKAKHDD